MTSVVRRWRRWRRRRCRQRRRHPLCREHQRRRPMAISEVALTMPPMTHRPMGATVARQAQGSVAPLRSAREQGSELSWRRRVALADR